MAQAKKIKIPEPDRVFNKAFIPFITEVPDTVKPLTIHEGGRGSSKSRSIAQFLSLYSLKHKCRFALVRKVADTIRNSQFKEIQDQVNDWKLESEFDFLTTYLTIKNKRGSEFISVGLDKASKIKSLANVDIVWIEEAEELTADDFLTLSLTVRGNSKSGKPKRIILSFNRTAGNWTEKEFFNADGSFIENPNIYHLHTTFQDNKFLDRAFLDRLEYLRTHDTELYRKNALGLPIALKGLVYQNWKIGEFPENCTEVIYGLDFGFHPDPTVLLKVGRIGMNLYVDELIYDRHLTNTDLIQRMGELQISKYADIYADSADPSRIEEISRAEYNVKPCEKGQGSVEFGIDVVKRYKVHITPHSTNTRKDFENYKYKTNGKGETISPPVPAHFGSHGPDGVRYPVATHWGYEYRQVTRQDMRSVQMEEMESVSVMDNYV